MDRQWQRKGSTGTIFRIYIGLFDCSVRRTVSAKLSRRNAPRTRKLLKNPWSPDRIAVGGWNCWLEFSWFASWWDWRLRLKRRLSVWFCFVRCLHCCLAAVMVFTARRKARSAVCNCSWMITVQGKGLPFPGFLSESRRHHRTFVWGAEDVICDNCKLA